MYKIINDNGDLIGMTEFVRYIKISQSGSFVATSMEDAQGIVYKNTVYNLDDKNVGANTTVSLLYVDAGDIILNLEKTVAKLKSIKDEDSSATSQIE